MKKTNVKDLFRFIRKTKVSFLSVGIFMGVSFGVFLGIYSAAQSLREATDRYYEDYHYSDIEIHAADGFTNDDIEQLKDLDSVADVQGNRETYSWAEFNNGRYLTRFMEYSNKLDQYNLIEGTMPKEADECVIDYSLNYHDGLQIGDTIDVTSFDDQVSGLVSSHLKITGYVTQPYALSKDKENRRGFAPYGDGSVYCYVLLNENAFDSAVFADCDTTLYVSVKDADQYSSFSSRYKDKVDAAADAIEAMDLAKDWTIADRGTNASFIEIDSFADSLSNISWSFSIIFIVVSLIIVFTMLSRLIDEQRLYTGIKKAVGFRTHEILMFFLLYTLLSSLIGVGIGLPLNFYIEDLAYNSYAGRFWFEPDQQLFFSTGWAVGVYGVLTLIAVLATVFAVFSSAVERPTTLLLGEKPPKNIAKVLKHVIPNWSRLNTFSKMIYCNIFSNPKRLVSVIAGIAGSLALLLIGVLMHSSIVRVPSEQAKITVYDQLIVCDDTKEVQNILDTTDGVSYQRTQETNCVFKTGDVLGAATLACLADGYEDYIKIKDTSGAVMQIPSDSALISTKIADVNHLKVGSKLKLLCSGNEEITVTVGGIFQNYAYNSVIVAPDYYQKLFGSEPDMKQFYVTFDKAVSTDQQNAMIESVKAAKGFLAIKSESRFDDYFLEMAENLMAVLLILIILAAFLVAVVIYNTVVMNIIRRKSELAMLMINGFSRKDIRRYISREFWSMAIAGMIVGTVLGCFLSIAVDRIVEPVYCQFVRTPGITACVQAVGMAVILAIVLNALAMRMLRKIRITDTTR